MLEQPQVSHTELLSSLHYYTLMMLIIFKKVTASPTELISHVQNSMNAWGGLAIATGAAIKPEKCFAYLWYTQSSDTVSLWAPYAACPLH
jgi:hypothetical protein